MTDSGGYQVLEYGFIDVEPRIMAQFEKDIESDICIPLDKPTGYGLEYERAKDHVEQTLKNAKETLAWVSEGGREDARDENDVDEAVWVGPIQGAEHLDLINYSADALDKWDSNFLHWAVP